MGGLIMLNTPNSIKNYEPLDPKLGIKSSLKEVKSTIALLILLWESNYRPAVLPYCEPTDINNKKSITIPDTLLDYLYKYLEKFLVENKISEGHLRDCINENQLYKAQMEPLKVAFELIWKLAKIEFAESTVRSYSSERTGENRYPKKIYFSINMDIIHSIIEENYNGYRMVLLAWLKIPGTDLKIDNNLEKRLCFLLTALSENALFKLQNGANAITFHQNEIYAKALQSKHNVNIVGTSEVKGPLRILKNIIGEKVNPYLESASSPGVTEVKIADGLNNVLEEYQKRVETYLELSGIKVINNIPDDRDDIDGEEDSNVSNNDIGKNILLYGVPGCGKSYLLNKKYKIDDACKNGYAERIVFHPDYTYQDFVGQIMPVLKTVDIKKLQTEKKEEAKTPANGFGSSGNEHDKYAAETSDPVRDKKIIYEFIDGPFTRILKRAYEASQSGDNKPYYLVIEEITRGNAAAIFGDIFQLLDRKVDGESEYIINNADIAEKVYGDKTHAITIPKNLTLLATMNTSDQNVFPLDNAFKRRWELKMIDNKFTDGDDLRNEPIIINDHEAIRWEDFMTIVNDEILH
jgi:5-methylcytosine-specific restriction protein B